MDSISNLSLTGTIGSYSRLTGHVSSGSSLQGTLTGNDTVSGSLAIGTVLEAELKSFIIADNEGNEVSAVLVDDEVVVTATAGDIRKGKTALSYDGLVVGTCEDFTCYFAEGYVTIPNGERFVIPHEYYDYDNFQAVVCRFNTNVANSVGVIKVALNNSVYDVQSTEPISAIVKDDVNKCIDLGIVNDTGNTCIIRYFIHKETN